MQVQYLLINSGEIFVWSVLTTRQVLQEFMNFQESNNKNTNKNLLDDVETVVKMKTCDSSTYAVVDC